MTVNNTDNHDYPLITEFTEDDEWGPIINTQLIQALETDSVVVTTSADKSTTTPHNGALLYETDTGKWFEGDGSAWNATEIENRLSGVISDLSTHESAGNPHPDSAADTDLFSGSHGDLTNVNSDDHHSKYTDSNAQSAINADTDHGATASHDYFSGSHTDLSDIGSDDHHAKYTDAEAISVINNDTDHGSTAQHDYFSGDHGDLANVNSDDHHAKYTDSDAETAINNDADHGSTASHDYFSGSHNDLSDVGSDDHHSKYTDSEAISAINNDTDHGSTASHDYFSGSHDDLSNVGSDDHHSQNHDNSDHTEAYIADGDGTARDYWIIANGASDPSGATANDLIFEEEA